MFVKNSLLLIGLVLLAVSIIAQGDQGPCVEEEAAVEACSKANGCDECADQTQQEPTEESTMAVDPQDVNAVAEQMTSLLRKSCDAFKDTICQSKSCCPKCSSELEAFYDCASVGFRSEMDSALSNLKESLSGLVRNTTEMPDLNLTCDPIAHCAGGEITPGGGSSTIDGDDGGSAGGNGAFSSYFVLTLALTGFMLMLQ